MTTIQEHAIAVAAVVRASAAGRGERVLPIAASAVSAAPARYRARTLSEPVQARSDVPRFDNSQMDGFAVVAADTADAPVTLPVAAAVAAGDPGGTLATGFAAPVMTGAPIPDGADAVVPVERTTAARFDVAEVGLPAPVAAGTFVRPRGSDVTAGATLASAGSPLRVAQLGAFAAADVPSITVHRRLRVLLVTSGKELRRDGAPLGEGQIHDAIGGMLAVAVTDAGAKVRAVQLTSDDPAQLWALILEHADWADLVVTVGGVSKGAFEVVKLALAPRGVRFDHLAMQPGGPQGLGTVQVHGRDVAVVCVPGNPVSALISFEAFLRPVLREVAGLSPIQRITVRAPLAVAVDSPAHQHQLRRATLREDGTVLPLGGPGSHLIAHYGAANALFHVPVGVTRLEAGDEVEVWRIDD